MILLSLLQFSAPSSRHSRHQKLRFIKLFCAYRWESDPKIQLKNEKLYLVIPAQAGIHTMRHMALGYAFPPARE